MTIKSVSLASTTILFLMFSNSALSQKIEPKKRITEPDHTISSEIMGKDYQLYISFPGSYSTKDTTSYPVLYVLDGLPAFPMIRGAHNVLSFGKEIEEVIIVGIGSGLDFPNWSINRHYDYTPSVDSASLRSTEKEYGFPKKALKAGGAEEFLECIQNEIIPFVDEHYKTNTDRGITGHSLGGLFTAYCLMNSDGYFTRFGINSPSFWWDSEKLLDQAVSKFTTNKTWDIPPTKVYISVGEKEGPTMVPEKQGPTMVPNMLKFSSWLESNNYENIDLNWQIFDSESHFSVVPANISKTISTLYGNN